MLARKFGGVWQHQNALSGICSTGRFAEKQKF
jgi:hypothetical protein